MKRTTKKLVILMLLFASPSFSKKSIEGKILMLISEGFYAPEYFKPRRIFENKGYTVEVAGKILGEISPDHRQLKTHPSVKVDLTFEQVKVDQYQAIVFAGGNGAWEDFFPNEVVHKIVTDTLKSKKILGLLCSSTGLLGVVNNLDGRGHPVAKGRKVTGYKRVVALLKNLGKVQYLSGEDNKPFVVKDKNLITGRDPMSSELFAQTIVKSLRDSLQRF